MHFYLTNPYVPCCVPIYPCFIYQMIYHVYMKEKKLFSFQFEESLKERMKVISKHRCRSIAYLINESLVESLKVWEDKMNKFNEQKQD